MDEVEALEQLAIARACDAIASAIVGGRWLRMLVLARKLAQLRRVSPLVVARVAELLAEISHALDDRGGNHDALRDLIHHYRYDGSIAARLPSAKGDPWQS